MKLKSKYHGNDRHEGARKIGSCGLRVEHRI